MSMLPHEPDTEPRRSTVALESFSGGRTYGATGALDSLVQLDVLSRLCHAFTSATTLDEVARSVGPWIEAATGSDHATFRLLVPDTGGRLRTVASNETSEAGRKRSARRRNTFRDKSPAVIPLNRPGGAQLGFFPLVSRGEPVGMLEVTAPESVVEARRDLLLALASQVAIALRNARERSFLERQRSPMIGFMDLVRGLVGARTPKRAIAVAARLSFEQMEVPVGGWGMAEDQSGLELTAMRGLDPEARQGLRSSMRRIPPWNRQSRDEWERHIAAFADLTGAANGVSVLDAGDALLMIGGRSPVREPFLENLEALLRDVLRSMAITARAERRNRELDMGIAWTAHELRRPMLELRLLLSSVLKEQANGGTQEGIDILTRQLDELVKGVDGMLRWAVGGPPVHSRSFDLCRLVESIVDASRPEKGRGRLQLTASSAVTVRGDRSQVQHAIENLVVNALTYSPADTPVKIDIEPDDEGVTVTVRDQGLGIPAAYRDAIFDPFVRAAAGSEPRSGQGLGLFIAKQIVEGHGGALWLEPGRKGATFRLRLPRESSGSPRFAS